MPFHVSQVDAGAREVPASVAPRSRLCPHLCGSQRRAARRAARQYGASQRSGAPSRASGQAPRLKKRMIFGIPEGCQPARPRVKRARAGTPSGAPSGGAFSSFAFPGEHAPRLSRGLRCAPTPLREPQGGPGYCLSGLRPEPTRWLRVTSATGRHRFVFVKNSVLRPTRE